MSFPSTISRRHLALSMSEIFNIASPVGSSGKTQAKPAEGASR
jgi:hypothetical protein